MALVFGSYIVQKIPDLIPDHSTNFQEYAPSQELAGYKVTGTKLYVEDHGSYFSKSVSFSFENSNLRFGEENGGSSYSSSCKGYVPAGSCRNVTTPKGTIYAIEPGLKDTGEIVRWNQGTTYLYMGIEGDLRNKVSDAELSAFIDSLKPTHYDSIPIVRTKPVED